MELVGPPGLRLTLGFRVKGSGLRVWGLGFWHSVSTGVHDFQF